MLMILLRGFSAAVLLSAGLGLILFLDQVTWEEVFGAVALFLGGVAARQIVRFGVIIFLLSLIPYATRKSGKDRLKKVAIKSKMIWKNLHWSIRFGISAILFLLFCAVMVIVGFALGVIALPVWVFSIGFASQTTLLLGLRATALPFLARLAAGAGMKQFFPAILRMIPDSWKDPVNKRYQRLWRVTIKQLVRGRIVLGRRAASILKEGPPIIQYNPFP